MNVLTVQAEGGAGGALFGARLSVEGTILGVVLGYTAALAPSAGLAMFDVIQLAQARLACLVVSSARGRLRLEAGAHLAVAPLTWFVAPAAGLSGTLGLTGHVGVEARVHGCLWPYAEFDASVGLTFGSDEAGMSVGVRALYLNDNGALGKVNADDTDDFFVGPYMQFALLL